MKYLYAILNFILLVLLFVGFVYGLDEQDYWDYAEKFIFVMSSMAVLFSVTQYWKSKERHNLVDFLATAFFWAGIVLLVIFG